VAKLTILALLCITCGNSKPRTYLIETKDLETENKANDILGRDIKKLNHKSKQSRADYTDVNIQINFGGKMRFPGGTGQTKPDGKDSSTGQTKPVGIKPNSTMNMTQSPNTNSKSLCSTPYDWTIRVDDIFQAYSSFNLGSKIEGCNSTEPLQVKKCFGLSTPILAIQATNVIGEPMSIIASTIHGFFTDPDTWKCIDYNKSSSVDFSKWKRPVTFGRNVGIDQINPLAQYIWAPGPDANNPSKDQPEKCVCGINIADHCGWPITLQHWTRGLTQKYLKFYHKLSLEKKNEVDTVIMRYYGTDNEKLNRTQIKEDAKSGWLDKIVMWKHDE